MSKRMQHSDWVWVLLAGLVWGVGCTPTPVPGPKASPPEVVGATLLTPDQMRPITVDEGIARLTPANTRIGVMLTNEDGEKVWAEFRQFHGIVTLTDNRISVKRIDLEIDSDSLESKAAELVEQLKSRDGLDVEHFRLIGFFANNVAPAFNSLESGELRDFENHRIRGDLTLRGETRQLSFPARIELFDGARGLVLMARFWFDPAKYGLAYEPEDDRGVELVVEVSQPVESPLTAKKPGSGAQPADETDTGRSPQP
ncbi:MAG TPA: hypothetical protein DDY91_11240 [Planctomycetaceae bacterium]|nr:hypothetical protein [Planctomycetaceae bacterium]